jgi:hypothetical protein
MTSSSGLRRQTRRCKISSTICSRHHPDGSPTRREPATLHRRDTHIISTAIMVERQEEGHAFGVQRPVYFISEVFSESKVRYPMIQKYFTVYSSLLGSFATTSMHTISWWSPTSHWRISSTIGMLPSTSPSGQRSWEPSHSTSSPGQPSSHRH